MGLQSKTKKLAQLESGQGELPLGEVKRRVPRPLDLSILYSRTTFHGALLYVIECGNFEKDKQLYQPLGIDAGNWTRIKQGEMSFPQEKEEALQALCGNDGLVLWRAHRAGKGVYDLQEAKDKRIAELEAKNAQLQSDLDTLKRYWQIQFQR